MTVSDFTISYLFSCPVYKIRIDPNLYDKEKIINDIKYNKSLKNTRNDTQYNFGNCDIHHSFDDYDNKNFRSIDYDKLKIVYTEIFNNFFSKELYTVKELKYDFKIVNYSAMTEGQYFPAHNHMDCDFSTIHYLNFKKDHMLTQFHNPANFASYLQYLRPELNDKLDSKVLDNSYLWKRFQVPVEEDDMLIFPAVLDHEVPAQGPTKESRIMVSSNIWLMKTSRKLTTKRSTQWESR